MTAAAAAALLVGAAAAAAQTPPDPTARLERLKLREEIRNLRSDRSVWRLVPSYAGVLTAIVAVAGLAFTAAAQLRETRKLRREELREREADRQQRDKDRIEREESNRARIEERFRACIAELGSDASSRQASAAIALLSFLKPGYESYREQVLVLVLAQLKILFPRLEAAKSSDGEAAGLESLNRLLVRVFEQAAHSYLPGLPDGADRSLLLDLSRTSLNRIDLTGLDLSGADIAFAWLENAKLSGRETSLRRVMGREAHLENAHLSRADLTEARLQHAFCTKTKFHEARLVSADLRYADLTAAEFQRAEMQGARFRGAVMRGAQFQEAVLDDAHFEGADIDGRTLETLVRAGWEAAHFDDVVRARLAEIAAARAGKPAQGA